jgi:3-hydroxy-9,10-secoandrosta-1,3,5(10)-triene-9,17-dione monooxygenase
MSVTGVLARGAASASIAPEPAELLARARALAPVLRERAARATADHRLPDETIADLQAAGLFRILQPRRWGGFEMHPNVFYDVQQILAEACMSTGWVYGVVGGHPYELALFADAAQREVWGQDDSVLVSSSYQPVGKVERVEGGFRLSGQWGFSSGSQHCQWVLLGAMIPPTEPGGPPDMRTFLVPRADYEIIENWNVFGLQGTGSHDIKVDGAFVPEHRTHKAVDGFLCQNPGQAENDGPLFGLPWAQIFLRLVSTAALGGARGAIAGAVQIAQSRISSNTGKASKADPILLNAIAKAHAQVEEMSAVLRRNFDDMLGDRATDLTLEKRALYRYQSASVVRRCAELVGELLPLLGGRAIYMSSPVVQPWLDLNAARAHVANDPNNFGPDLFGSLVGEPPSFMFL